MDLCEKTILSHVVEGMVKWQVFLNCVLKGHIGADGPHKKVALVQRTILFGGFALLLDLLQRLLQNELQFILLLHFFGLRDLSLSFFIVPLVVMLFLLLHVCCLWSHIMVLQFLLFNFLDLRLDSTLLDRCILLVILWQMEVIILIIDVVKRFIFVIWVVSFRPNLLLVLMGWVYRVLNTMVFFTILSHCMTTIWIFLIHSSHTLGGFLKTGNTSSQWSITFLIILLMLLSVSFLDIIWRLVLIRRVSIEVVFWKFVSSEIALLIFVRYVCLRWDLIKPMTRAIFLFSFMRLSFLLFLDILQVVDLLEGFRLLKFLNDFVLSINNFRPKAINFILFEASPELG